MVNEESSGVRKRRSKRKSLVFNTATFRDDVTLKLKRGNSVLSSDQNYSNVDSSNLDIENHNKLKNSEKTVENNLKSEKKEEILKINQKQCEIEQMKVFTSFNNENDCQKVSNREIYDGKTIQKDLETKLNGVTFLEAEIKGENDIISVNKDIDSAILVNKDIDSAILVNKDIDNTILVNKDIDNTIYHFCSAKDESKANPNVSGFKLLQNDYLGVSNDKSDPKDHVNKTLTLLSVNSSPSEKLEDINSEFYIQKNAISDSSRALEELKIKNFCSKMQNTSVSSNNGTLQKPYYNKITINKQKSEVLSNDITSKTSNSDNIHSNKQDILVSLKNIHNNKSNSNNTGLCKNANLGDDESLGIKEESFSRDFTMSEQVLRTRNDTENEKEPTYTENCPIIDIFIPLNNMKITCNINDHTNNSHKESVMRKKTIKEPYEFEKSKNIPKTVDNEEICLDPDVSATIHVHRSSIEKIADSNFYYEDLKDAPTHINESNISVNSKYTCTSNRSTSLTHTFLQNTDTIRHKHTSKRKIMCEQSTKSLDAVYAQHSPKSTFKRTKVFTSDNLPNFDFIDTLNEKSKYVQGEFIIDNKVKNHNNVQENKNTNYASRNDENVSKNTKTRSFQAYLDSLYDSHAETKHFTYSENICNEIDKKGKVIDHNDIKIDKRYIMDINHNPLRSIHYAENKFDQKKIDSYKLIPDDRMNTNVCDNEDMNDKSNKQMPIYSYHFNESNKKHNDLYHYKQTLDNESEIPFKMQGNDLSCNNQIQFKDQIVITNTDDGHLRSEDRMRKYSIESNPGTKNIPLASSNIVESVGTESIDTEKIARAMFKSDRIFSESCTNKKKSHKIITCVSAESSSNTKKNGIDIKEDDIASKTLMKNSKTQLYSDYVPTAAIDIDFEQECLPELPKIMNPMNSKIESILKDGNYTPKINSDSKILEDLNEQITDTAYKTDKKFNEQLVYQFKDPFEYEISSVESENVKTYVQSDTNNQIFLENHDLEYINSGINKKNAIEAYNVTKNIVKDEFKIGNREKIAHTCIKSPKPFLDNDFHNLKYNTSKFQENNIEKTMSQVKFYDKYKFSRNSVTIKSFEKDDVDENVNLSYHNAQLKHSDPFQAVMMNQDSGQTKNAINKGSICLDSKPTVFDSKNAEKTISEEVRHTFYPRLETKKTDIYQNIPEDMQKVSKHMNDNLQIHNNCVDDMPCENIEILYKQKHGGFSDQQDMKILPENIDNQGHINSLSLNLYNKHQKNAQNVDFLDKKNMTRLPKNIDKKGPINTLSSYSTQKLQRYTQNVELQPQFRRNSSNSSQNFASATKTISEPDKTISDCFKPTSKANINELNLTKDPQDSREKSFVLCEASSLVHKPTIKSNINYTENLRINKNKLQDVNGCSDVNFQSKSNKKLSDVIYSVKSPHKDHYVTDFKEDRGKNENLATKSEPKDTKPSKKINLKCKLDAEDFQSNITDQINFIRCKKPPKYTKISHKEKVTINGKCYTKVKQIGKGGCGKVFLVLLDNETFALKEIRKKGENESIIADYKNEISFLEQLKDDPYIVQLIDFSESDEFIYILMEHGECDLSAVIKSYVNQHKKRISTRKELAKGNSSQNNENKCLETTKTILPNFTEAQDWSVVPINTIRSFWEQMLIIVLKIHSLKIVHRDLKPANFLLVKGRLKLIDFGIAKAIKGDTTNFQTQSQVGTINYMAPEALECDKKVGRSSDVWSLGCILYEMVYGKAPLHKCENLLKKVRILQDKNYVIEYPALSNSTDFYNVKKTLKNCLQWNPKSRKSIQELMESTFVGKNCLHLSINQAKSLIKNVFKFSKEGAKVEHTDRIFEIFMKNLERNSQ